jgi:hypothetical protein
MAVDLWREYLRKFTFTQLFTSLEDEGYEKKTAFEVIREKVRERLTQESVVEVSPVGKLTGSVSFSREYQVLRDRGIQVRYAPIRNLRFPLSVEQQLENGWFSSWLSRAKSDRDIIDSLRSYRELAGERDGVKDFALSAIRNFNKDTYDLPRTGDAHDQRIQMQIALDLLLRGSLRQCLSDPELHKRLSQEEKYLLYAIDWLRKGDVNG